MSVQEKLQNIKDRAKEHSTKAAAGTVIALGIVGLAVCSNSETPRPEPTSITTEAPSQEPKPEPTETERPDWYYEEDIIERSPIPAELEQYRDMPLEDFQQLPVQEQWLYVSYLTSYRDEFVSSRPRFNPDNTPPTTLTAESSAQDIFNDYLMTLGMAAYQTTEVPEPQQDGTCGALDADSAGKIISALNAPLVNQTPNALNMFNEVNSLASGSAICPGSQHRYELLDTNAYQITNSEMQTVTVDGQELQSMVITYTIEGLPAAQDEFRVVFHLLPITNPDGTPGFRAVRGDTFAIF